jgi:hypothetical protein
MHLILKYLLLEYIFCATLWQFEGSDVLCV